MFVRVGLHLLPSIRNPNFGTALALHRAAQPGVWGAVRDLLRTITGAAHGRGPAPAAATAAGAHPHAHSAHLCRLPARRQPLAALPGAVLLRHGAAAGHAGHAWGHDGAAVELRGVLWHAGERGWCDVQGIDRLPPWMLVAARVGQDKHAPGSRAFPSLLACLAPQLLSDPLTLRRQAALAAALEHASVPLAAAQPLAAHLMSSAVLAGARRCSSPTGCAFWREQRAACTTPA